MKSAYATVSKWIDKDEALLLGYEHGFEPIAIINITQPSLEEAIDQTTLRDIYLWEILDNKMSNKCHRHEMIETMIPPIDIYEEIPLEPKKGDSISRCGSYFMKTSSDPHSYEKSPESIDVSTASCEIFNLLIFSASINFERVAVDAYIYHKYCRSLCENLEIGL